MESQAHKSLFHLVEGQSFDLESIEVTVEAPNLPSAEDLIERLHQILWSEAPRRQRLEGEPIAEGDDLECDIVTVVGGKILPDGCHHCARFEVRDFLHLPGFIDEILDMKTWSAKSFLLTFPQDYQVQALRGVEATYYVEARRAYEVNLEPLEHSEQLSRAGLGDTIDEALEIVAARIDEEQGDELLVTATQAVLDALGERVEAKIPDVTVDEELRLLWEKNRAPIFLGKAFSESTIENAEKDFVSYGPLRAQAAHRLRIALALAKVIEENNLNPSEEGVDDFIRSLTPQVGTQDEIEKVLLNHPDTQRDLAQQSLYLQAVEFVMTRARFKVSEV